MKHLRRLAISLAAALASAAWVAPVVAQEAGTAAPAATESSATIDPARLAAAQRLIAVIIPHDGERAYAEQMLRPLYTNIMAGMRENPQLKAAMLANPEMGRVFDRMIDRMTEISIDGFVEDMPLMRSAMARAYARRFDTAQLAEINAFAATRTGLVFFQRSAQIAGDEDIAALIRGMMERTRERMEPLSQEFRTEIAAAMAKAASNAGQDPQE